MRKNNKKRTITKQDVLENLSAMIGKEFNADDIICAFEDFEEEGKTEVIVKESENDGYDAIAYINSPNSTQFLFSIHTDEEGVEIIDDVWMWGC